MSEEQSSGMDRYGIILFFVHVKLGTKGLVSIEIEKRDNKRDELPMSEIFYTSHSKLPFSILATQNSHHPIMVSQISL